MSWIVLIVALMGLSSPPKTVLKDTHEAEAPRLRQKPRCVTETNRREPRTGEQLPDRKRCDI